ncbi:MAG: hypothetical protein ACLFQB_06940 [Chitinispirillaceae bacterium]
MWLKWFPWKFILKKVARAQGFTDPITLLSRFNKFAQPSEVLAPVELLRAGAVMHARGLINSQVIQHNLDWVWPYWAERQFDPQDRSFIPRAFSLTHINLTHRNWTAVGVPGFQEAPVVDPRGLIMPFFDSWSLDAWVMSYDGRRVIPSRLAQAEQRMDLEGDSLRIITTAEDQDCSVQSVAEVVLRNGLPLCRLTVRGKAPSDGSLIVSLRPYNMEGISFIHRIRLLSSGQGWEVNGKDLVWFEEKPSIRRFACYNQGDVYHWALSSKPDSRKEISCDVGLASAFAGYRLKPGQTREVSLEIPLSQRSAGIRTFDVNLSASDVWKKSMKSAVFCRFPVKNYQSLYEKALRTLVLHTPRDSYAGPYTYKRFWFRDAAFIVYSLLVAGLPERALTVIKRFFHRQTPSGYFLSQEGEWDSNGQALWSMAQYCRFTATAPPSEWLESALKAGQWIMKKRRETVGTDSEGLFPAGFSAEHLGPNDHYYWDNFWGVAGLEAAAFLLAEAGRGEDAEQFRRERGDFLLSIENSLSRTAGQKRGPAMPASPNRRLDSGAVGSLAAGYPLQIWSCSNEKLLLTAKYLYDQCLINGAFYHDISHSGINPYLSLHIAQVMLGASDCSFSVLMEGIASLASPTGQWPEAIHPQLGTGCMGDGQHTWAAAEWISMVRNCFVREDGEKLLLCQGILPEYLDEVDELSFGPAPTCFGAVTVRVKKNQSGRLEVFSRGEWFDTEPVMEIAMCGKERVRARPGEITVV